MKTKVAILRSLSIAIAAFAGVTGCAASTDPGPAPAQEKAGQAKQADSATHSYSVVLHEVNVSKPRSKNTDTIVVGMKVLVNDEEAPDSFRTFTIGDHGHEDVYPELWTAFEANDSDDVKVLVAVVNAYNPPNAVTGASQFLDQLGADVRWLANGDIYPLDNADRWLRSQYDFFNASFAGGCDGVVAADAIHTYGWQLNGWTEGGDSYGPAQRHDGNDSPNGCGSNSLYFTEYYFHRNS